jgi:sugar/nucleoside kinase (ribokinase family)
LTRFAVLGDCTLDIAIAPQARRRHAGDVPARIRLGPGGQAANVAVRLARIGGRSSVRLVAPMADDLASRLLREALAADGVRLAAVPAARSSAVAIIVDATGERTMLSDRQSLPAAAAAAALAGADWVHCSGYALLDDETGDELAAVLGARPASVTLSVGGGSVPPEPRRVARFTARLRAAAPQLCLLSRDEAAAMLGRSTPPPARRAAAMLAGLADVVVVTDGARGSAATFDGRTFIAPLGVAVGRVVDATGAGDGYAAAMVARLARGSWPPSAARLEGAMASGARLGARVARVAGAQARVTGERRMTA